MQVDLTREQEADLAQLAGNIGKDPAVLAQEAILGMLNENVRFHSAVHEGIPQADRGEFIEEEEMDARFEQMLRS